MTESDPRSAVERIAAFAADALAGRTFADEDLRDRLIDAVQQLDARRVADLMELLAEVRPAAAFRQLIPAFNEFSSLFGRTRNKQDSDHPAEIHTSPFPMCSLIRL